MMHWFGNFGMGFGFGGLLMIAFWGLIIFGLIGLFNYFAGSTAAGSRPDATPVETAKMRFARGEISRTELQEIMETLRAANSQGT